MIRISPTSHTQEHRISYRKTIFAELPKGATQKDEGNTPILGKSKRQAVATFAELLKNWGTAPICEVYFKYIVKSIENIFTRQSLLHLIDFYKNYFALYVV